MDTAVPIRNRDRTLEQTGSGQGAAPRSDGRRRLVPDTRPLMESARWGLGALRQVLRQLLPSLSLGHSTEKYSERLSLSRACSNPSLSSNLRIPLLL